MTACNTFRGFQRAIPLALGALWAASTAISAQPGDMLLAGFQSPGVEARPRVWWHWMNANVTEDGIAKDLDWFSRTGIGGFTAFDGGGGAARFVEKPLVYMSDDWKHAFRFAMERADKLGLEASIAASPGWSQSGGPWVKPEEAMKKYVWTETWVDGGKHFTGKLTQPADAAGGFQDAMVRTREKLAPFYRDARVFAYRVAADARSQADLKPVITTNAAFDANGKALPVTNGRVVLDAARLSDGSVTEVARLGTTSETEPSWVELTYEKPVTMRGVSLANGEAFAAGWRPEAGPRIRILAGDAASSLKIIAEGLYTGAQRTFAFPATTARLYRVEFLPATPPLMPRALPAPRTPSQPGVVNHRQPPAPTGGPAQFSEFFGGPSTRGFALAELVLRPVAPVEQFEVKAAFGVVNDYYAIPTPDTGPAVDPKSVLDLTAKMRSDGSLDWQAPAGRWVVVRLGYSLTGKENGPASEEATGLEADKLNAAHMRHYINTYLDMYASATGSSLMGAHGLNALLNDSYEARFQNWTDDMLEQFRALRGYDPSPWLPVLTGVVVRNAADSDRFLWDWRRTIYELLAKSHYGVLAEEARKRGLKSYAEALEDSRSYMGDDMEMRRFADVPMGSSGATSNQFDGAQLKKKRLVDNRGAASIAHVYGRAFVGSEAFTSASNAAMPETLKSTADQLFLQGVNRFFIHTSAHQPGDQGPGSSLNNIGFFFTRNENWAGMAKPWVDFLTRTSWMLQQGRYVADFAYFYGEEAPVVGVWATDQDRELPEHRGFDLVNADAVLNHLQWNNGAVESDAGMRYPLIYVGGRSSQMTLPVLKKLASLVEQGAAIAGDRPQQSPSLADDPSAFQRAADALWGSGAPGLRLVGKGRVFVGFKADTALTRMGIPRDFDFPIDDTEEPFDAIHRRTGDADIYYVASRRARSYTYDVTFRVGGRNVELWDPVTGETRQATYRTDNNGRTVVPLTLNGADSVFVILRGNGPPARTVPTVADKTVNVFEGAWSVAFQAGRGAPASVTLAALVPLNESDVPGVRYFSGVATYSRTLDLVQAPAAGERLALDLGKVGGIARVRVNGTEAGIVWRPPFRVDVAKYLKAGANRIEVEVANSWKNRLIGDQQEGMTQVAFAPAAAEDPDGPLLPSGLIGPVRLVRVH